MTAPSSVIRIPKTSLASDTATDAAVICRLPSLRAPIPFPPPGLFGVSDRDTPRAIAIAHDILFLAFGTLRNVIPCDRSLHI